MFGPLREMDVTAQPRPISALHTWLPMKPLPPSTTILLQGGGAVAVLRDISASMHMIRATSIMVSVSARLIGGSLLNYGILRHDINLLLYHEERSVLSRNIADLCLRSLTEIL